MVSYFTTFLIFSSVLLFIFIPRTGDVDYTIYSVCFFLIATIGVSHGAYDFQRAKKTFREKNVKNWKFWFFLIYICISLLVLIIWQFIPTILLFLFFLIAAYHFGEEDLELFFQDDSLTAKSLYFLRGLIVISFPLYLNYEQTIFFINELTGIKAEDFVSIFVAELIFYQNVIYLAPLILFISFRNKLNRKKIAILLGEVLVVAAIFYYLPLIIAFTLYFVLMHSAKHIIGISKDLNKNNLKAGFRQFIDYSIFLTFLTIVFGLAVMALITNSQAVIVNSYIDVIFVGLLALTFPHILTEKIIN